MSETTITPLRKAKTSIPDRPRSPPRYAPIDTFANTMSAPSWKILPSWVTEDFRKRGLHNALAAGQIEVAQFFLEQGAKLDGDTVLKVVQSKSRSVKFLELFVKYGWDVNTPGYGGHTVLASVVDDESLVAWLLGKGADPNFGRPRKQKLNGIEADHESGLALDNAASTSTIAVIDLLIRGGAKMEYSIALHAATEGAKTYGDRIPMMEHLLELGFDVDGMDDKLRGPHGRGSPLMCAVCFSMIERARFLLDNGANPYLKNWRGRSPFDDAQFLHHTAFLDLFQGYCSPDR